MKPPWKEKSDALIEGATEGEWVSDDGQVIMADGEFGLHSFPAQYFGSDEDCDFVCHARTMMPFYSKLIEEMVRALRGVASVNKVLEAYEKGPE